MHTNVEALVSENVALKARIEELEAQNRRLSTSTWFGCKSRQGLEEELPFIKAHGKAIVYFDVDELKKANEKWGKPESSRRIKASIFDPHARRREDSVIGQWFSGDEFAAIVPIEDAIGYAERIQSRLRENELSATFYITPCREDVPLDKQIDRAEDVMKSLKDEGRRGRIVYNG